MITLYHCSSARSFRPLWMLEELRLSYELIMLPFPPRVHMKDYLAVNPLGTIPAFFDGAVHMTESSAICQYLAVRYGGNSGLAVGEDEPDYGGFLNALHFGEATLTFPQTLVLRYGQLEADERRQPQVVDDYARWFWGRLRAVESKLSGHDYMCADRFTAADISVGYALMLAQRLDLDERFGENVSRYWQRLASRPAYLRALERQAVETRTLQGADQ